MKRPKFRVWSKRRKDWLTADDHSLHCWSNWMMDIFTGEIIDFTLIGVGKDTHHYHLDPEPESYMDGVFLIKETPFVVQQWTGLVDEFGKDVYEGDIVSYILTHSNFTDVIEWQNYGWVMQGITEDSSLPLCDAYNMKVIGNIFENPELLNTKA